MTFDFKVGVQLHSGPGRETKSNHHLHRDTGKLHISFKLIFPLPVLVQAHSHLS